MVRVAFWTLSTSPWGEEKAQVLALPKHRLARSRLFPKDRKPFHVDVDSGFRNKSAPDRVVNFWTHKLCDSLDLLAENNGFDRVLIIGSETHPDFGRVRAYAGPRLACKIFTARTYLRMHYEAKADVRNFGGM